MTLPSPAPFTLAMQPNAEGIYDLYLEPDGNLATAVGARAVALHVRWRLMTYFGEWFLDTAAGMRWLDDLMGKQYNPILAEVLIKLEVIQTPGVTGITALSLRYNGTQRNLIIRELEASTEYDNDVIWVSNLNILANPR